MRRHMGSTYRASWQMVRVPRAPRLLLVSGKNKPVGEVLQQGRLRGSGCTQEAQSCRGGGPELYQATFRTPPNTAVQTSKVLDSMLSARRCWPVASALPHGTHTSTCLAAHWPPVWTEGLWVTPGYLECLVPNNWGVGSGVQGTPCPHWA